VDFRRIVRGGAYARLPLDLTKFEEGSVIGETSRLYRREKDGMEIVVKAFNVSEFDSGEVDIEIENLSNLCHPLIAAPIGFALSAGALKIGRLHAVGGSLAEVVSLKPAWWTPTAKAEAIVGIALALRFAHGLGLQHGGLKAGNGIFDGGGRIQTTDFGQMRRDGGFSEEVKGWSPWADVSTLAMHLFEIVVGRHPPSVTRTDGDMMLRPGVPPFVSEIQVGI
jgi:serine/threonine protein kinase